MLLLEGREASNQIVEEVNVIKSAKSLVSQVQNLFVVSAETKTLETNQVFAPVSVPLQTVTTAALRS